MILSDLLKNPLTYWLRWLFNKYKFLHVNGKKNVKIDYLSHVTKSSMECHSTIYQSVRLHNVHLNSFSYVANHTVIIGATIGKFCSIGPNCRIGLGVHPSSDFVSTHPVFFSTESHVGLQFTKKNYLAEFEDISIGNDVWIGANVLIKDGVTVGDGAIVGAGAVVTKDVEPYAIVVGHPAKILRYRFTERQIEYLEQQQWWNKDISEIKRDYVKYHHIDELMEKDDLIN